MSFAEGTAVPVEKTRGEIEGLVRKYGATQFSSGWNGTEAAILFVCKSVRVRFSVPMPDPANEAIRKKARRGGPDYRAPTDANLAWAVAAEERRIWRCVLLAIKAKLEIVQSGIGTFEEEFLSHIVTDNGKTVFERISLSDNMRGRLLPAVGAP